MCLVLQVSGVRHRHRSDPNHVARKMARNRRTENEKSQRVFGPAGPDFTLPENERRCESFVSACNVPSNRELRARRDPHERPRDTRNCNTFRQSSELSNVAQTARRTQKH